MRVSRAIIQAKSLREAFLRKLVQEFSETMDTRLMVCSVSIGIEFCLAATVENDNRLCNVQVLQVLLSEFIRRINEAEVTIQCATAHLPREFPGGYSGGGKNFQGGLCLLPGKKGFHATSEYQDLRGSPLGEIRGRLG